MRRRTRRKKEKEEREGWRTRRNCELRDKDKR